MTAIQKFSKGIVVLLLASTLGLLMNAPSASAVISPDPTAGSGSNDSGSNSGCTVGNEASCPVNSGSCSTTVDTIANCADPAASSKNVQCTKTKCNLVAKYVNPLIALMSALVGVTVTISIIIGGIQYGSSAGDPQKVTAAKNRIRNSIIALAAFLFLYAFLQFLVPGGIFNR